MIFQQHEKRLNNIKNIKLNSNCKSNEIDPQVSHSMDKGNNVSNCFYTYSYKNNLIPNLLHRNVLKIENQTNLCRNCKCDLKNSFKQTFKNNYCDLAFSQSPLIIIDDNQDNSWRLQKYNSKLNCQKTPKNIKPYTVKKIFTKEIGISSTIDTCKVDECIQSTVEDFRQQRFNDNLVRVINITDKKNIQSNNPDLLLQEKPLLDNGVRKVKLIS